MARSEEHGILELRQGSMFNVRPCCRLEVGAERVKEIWGSRDWG